jgi:predicted RNase H-like HicB family nuclease/predicted RNA binding protein YcfA (HicA-like mRNA interferase family)
VPTDDTESQPGPEPGLPEVQGWSIDNDEAGIDASHVFEIASERVEFGERRGNVLPGRIRLCATEVGATQVAGVFEVELPKKERGALDRPHGAHPRRRASRGDGSAALGQRGHDGQQQEHLHVEALVGQRGARGRRLRGAGRLLLRIVGHDRHHRKIRSPVRCFSPFPAGKQLLRREVIAVLERHGFNRVRQSGRHVVLTHPDGRRVTEPVHMGRDLGRGLLRQMMRDGNLTVDDLLGRPSRGRLSGIGSESAPSMIRRGGRRIGAACPGTPPLPAGRQPLEPLVGSIRVLVEEAIVTEYEFTVVIERDEDGRFLAICPALQGCYTEGETEAEARALIEDAIRLHVEDRLAAGEPIYAEVGTSKVRVAL